MVPVAVAVTTAITQASGRCLDGCGGGRRARGGGFIILLSLGCVALLRSLGRGSCNGSCQIPNVARQEETRG